MARGLEVDTVWLATGRNWPDALSAAAVAGHTDDVLLLADRHLLHDAAPWLLANGERLTNIAVSGGENVLAGSVITRACLAVTG